MVCLIWNKNEGYQRYSKTPWAAKLYAPKTQPFPHPLLKISNQSFLGVSCHLQDLGQGIDVHSQGHRAVTFELGEGTFTKQQWYQGHMRTVHALDFNTFLWAIEIHVLAQVLQQKNGD